MVGDLGENLLGQQLAFSLGGNDELASAFIGWRFSVAQTNHFGLCAGMEGSFDTEESSGITGNLGMKWV